MRDGFGQNRSCRVFPRMSYSDIVGSRTFLDTVVNDGVDVAGLMTQPVVYGQNRPERTS